MHLIKLNATESTNTFLKEYSRSNDVENYMVVWAKHQTKGRGQMNARWHSEEGKNLTFSVMVKLGDLSIEKQFYLSKAVALGVREALVKFLPNDIMVKWPNDIMSGNKKMAGILIENRIEKGMLSESVIGIGLNVNQENFSKEFNGVSMRNLSHSEWNLELVLNAVVESIKLRMNQLYKRFFEELDKDYVASLYKYQEPSLYMSPKGERFMAKIVGVSAIGKLQLELENTSIKEFDLKEIKYL